MSHQTGAVKLKKSFRNVQSLETLYTGGRLGVTKNERMLVCAATDVVNLIDAETVQILRTFEGDEEVVTAVAVSPSGKFIAAASRSLLVRVWKVEDELLTAIDTTDRSREAVHGDGANADNSADENENEVLKKRVVTSTHGSWKGSAGPQLDLAFDSTGISLLQSDLAINWPSLAFL